MNKLLKIRAWDINNRSILYRDVYSLYWYSSKENYENDIPLREITEEDKNNLILMYGSSLKDKNGFEIYSGDIISTPDGIYFIIFENGSFFAEGLDFDSGAYLDVYADVDEEYSICEIKGIIYVNANNI